MPIIIDTTGGPGGGTTIPGTGAGGSSRIRRGTSRPSTIEACWFEPDDGYEVNLSTLLDDDQYKQGLSGRFLSPVAHTIEQSPNQPGGWYRGSRRGLAALRLPLVITGDTPDELRRRLVDLAAAVDVGPGWLHVETTWGVHRRIRAIYEDGIDEDPAIGGNETDFEVPLLWRALSSFWEPERPVQSAYGVNVSDREFFPGPPWILGETTIDTTWTETVEGDVKTWPIIRMTGPASGLTVANDRVGGALSFPGLILGNNDELVIDSRPLIKTMRTQSGQNLWQIAQGDMFPLLRGDNAMRVKALETTSRTKILVEYYPQYKGV